MKVTFAFLITLGFGLSMDKQERLTAALRGESVDRVPYSSGDLVGLRKEIEDAVDQTHEGALWWPNLFPSRGCERGGTRNHPSHY